MSAPGTGKAKYGEPEVPAPSVEEVVEAVQPEPRVERRGLDLQFLDYFGLAEQPFGVTPDLRFLYLGPKHQQALDALNYHTELNRGFLTLIAEPGMGKTSLLFHYMEGLRDQARTVYLFQTDCNSTELMRYLLADLGLDGMRSELPEMRSMLNQVLLGELQAGRKFVLVVDEAQNLDDKTLESIRLLSNFETPWMKLIHIVLAGQPQLAERLARPSLAQLRQRVALGIRLERFSRAEVDLYIDHRMWVAGFKGMSLFSLGARALIAERSEGIPRNINNICFCAMSTAWALGQKSIDRSLVANVLAEMYPETAVEKEPAAASAVAASKPIESAPAAKLKEPAPALKTVEEAPKVSPPAPASPPAAPAAAGFTVKTSAMPEHTSKVVVAGLVLLGVGWVGGQLGVGKWIEPPLQSLTSSVRKLILPEPKAAPQAPATASAPENPQANSNSNSVATDPDTDIPPQNAVEPPTSDGK